MVHEGRARTTVGHHMGELGLLVGTVGRYHDQPEPQAPDVGDGQVDAGGPRYEHPVAGSQPGAGQPPGHSRRPLQELTP